MTQESKGTVQVPLNLISKVQNCTENESGGENKNEWSSKQRRCYQRLRTGITYNNANGNVIRFITLTTSKETTSDIQRDFRILKMRINRKYGRFEYIRIRTNEGRGVLHILYVGTYIPQIFLSRVWNDIHKSPVVDIRAVNRIRNLGAYVVSQYLSTQRTSFVRYSWSWGWVYKGFVGYWHKIRREYFFKNPIEMWNKHLSGKIIKLDGKYLKPPPDVRIVALEQSMLDYEFLSFSSDTPQGFNPAYFVRLMRRCGWVDKRKFCSLPDSDSDNSGFWI